jgi:ribosomal protein S18 acetylase RimI-like enzyme
MTLPAVRGTIRGLLPEDEEQLFALFQVFAANERIARQFHPHPFDPATASLIANHSGLDVYLGFFRDEKLVGYAMLRGWDEGYEVPAFGIAVAPEHEGLGIGGQLLRACVEEARARGAERMMLKVHADNRRALQWYLSIGFQKTGTSIDGQFILELILGPA